MPRNKPPMLTLFVIKDIGEIQNLSIMNKSQLIDLYTQDQRKDVVYPDTRREITSTIIRHVDVSESAGGGTVIYSKLTAANADAVILEQVRYFEAIQQDFEWKVYDYDQPPDLKERLASHGFTIEEQETIMVLDLANTPGFLWEPVRHNIQRIHHPEAIADVMTIERQVWDEDMSGLGEYLQETIRNQPDRMSVYVAYGNDQPASAAWIYFPQNSQFASLWGGSTVPKFRRQGLYTALLAIRAQEAKVRGVRFLTVDASEMSRPILEKFGFTVIAYSYPCKWEHNP